MQVSLKLLPPTAYKTCDYRHLHFLERLRGHNKPKNEPGFYGNKYVFHHIYENSIYF